jgi:hypothetical protein
MTINLSRVRRVRRVGVRLGRIRDLILTALAVLFSVPPQPGGGYKVARYPRTAAGCWRYVREQILPTYLPVDHWLDAPVTAAAVLRRAAHWRTVSWIAALVLLAGVSAGGRLIPALATGVLLLAIGERGECLGWINGYTHHARHPHPTTTSTGGTW